MRLTPAQEYALQSAIDYRQHAEALVHGAAIGGWFVPTLYELAPVRCTKATCKALCGKGLFEYRVAFEAVNGYPEILEFRAKETGGQGRTGTMIKRLEDLPPELQTVFKRTADTGGQYRIVGITTEYDRKLERLRLFDITRIDHNRAQISLTATGEDLWEDYQERQASATPEPPKPQAMSHEGFFNGFCQLYDLNPADSDEWDVITIARQEHALVMTDRAEVERLKAENEQLRAALGNIRTVTRKELPLDTTMEQDVNSLLADRFDVLQITRNALKLTE